MLFEFIDKDVQVGVNLAMDPAQSHGSAVYIDNRGRADTVLFQVDYPSRLRFPTNEQLLKIFKQFDKLGFPALSISISRQRAGIKVYRRQDLKSA